MLIAGLAVTSGMPAAPEWVWIAAGGFLGLWALASMPLRQLRAVPDVHPHGRLVRQGPYRWIRHPMYLAVLLVAVGLAATDPMPGRIVMAFALAVLLVVKLVREEKLLCSAYPDYADYQANTWRLVPWVW